ncbi:MAG TPA: ATP-binding cassette domain-containing protein [Actinocrinis sp.]|nr:ATP-binding cassette domain-containing protein [Actinocrinis sp.]
MRTMLIRGVDSPLNRTRFPALPRAPTVHIVKLRALRSRRAQAGAQLIGRDHEYCSGRPEAVAGRAQIQAWGQAHRNAAQRNATQGSITAENLAKGFHVSARRPGRFSAVSSLISPQRVAKTAVDRVSFRIQRGELVAFLGPNGAGKSTTVIPGPYTYSYGY